MSKIAFITYAAFFPIFTTTLEGIKYVEPAADAGGLSLGASPCGIVPARRLPAATAERSSRGSGSASACPCFVIVAAEFIARGFRSGYLINDARTFFLVSQMLMAPAVIGIIGFISNVAQLESRLLRWRKPVRS